MENEIRLCFITFSSRLAMLLLKCKYFKTNTIDSRLSEQFISARNFFYHGFSTHSTTSMHYTMFVVYNHFINQM